MECPHDLHSICLTCANGLPANWPTEANDWNRGEHCANCNATGERLQPVGRGELECYACAIGVRSRRPAQRPLL